MATASIVQELNPVLRPIQRLVYGSKRWKLISFLMAATIFKAGIWYIPNIVASVMIVRSPFANPLSGHPDAQYIYWSWLAHFLAWLARANGKLSLFCFELLFSVAFTALFVLVVFARFEENDARTALVLFFVLPVSATAYFWVSGDSVTLFLMMLALAVPGSLSATFLAGIALGMQHFEQGSFAGGALALAMAWDSRRHRDPDRSYSVPWALTLVAGLVAGKLVLAGLFRYLDVDVNSGRFFWLHGHLKVVLTQFYYHCQLIFYSALGIGWVLIVKSAERGRKAIPFMVCLFGLLTMSLPIVFDQTRVGAIVTFPLIAVYCLLNRAFLKTTSRQFVCWVLVVWLIVPYIWVWGGVPKWSVFPFDVAFLLHKAFGWFAVPVNNPSWPFLE
jgi:hypothetical protein